MKVLFLGGYPPLAGFTATHGYWIAQYLSQAGVEVYVVSDGWDQDSANRCRIEPDDFQHLTSKNPKMFSLDPLQSRGLALSNPDAQSRLVSLALDVYERYGFDLIYTNLLPTYASAAYTVKEITQRPLVVSHLPSNFERVINDPYLDKYTQHILRNADLVLGYPEKFKFMQLAGVTRLQEMMPLGVTQPTEDGELPKGHWQSLEGKEVDPILPTILLTGQMEFVPYIRQAIYMLEQIEGKFNLLLSCSGEKVAQFKSVLAESDLAQRTVDLGVLAPWNQPSLLRSATMVISTFALKLTYTYDPAFTYQQMSLGIAPVLSEKMQEYSSSSYLELNSSNCIKFDQNLERVVSDLLPNANLRKKLGENALAEYRKIDQAGFLNLLRGVV